MMMFLRMKATHGHYEVLVILLSFPCWWFDEAFYPCRGARKPTV
jgi:hypothetical protein